MEELCKFKVTLNRVIYPSSGRISNGDWAVISCNLVESMDGNRPLESKYGGITLIGTFPELNYRDTYMCIGRYKFDEKYKDHQYEKVYFGTNYALDTKKDQITFLKNFMTESQIERMYETLDNPFEAIMNKDIHTLVKIKGIGVKVAERIIQKYEDNIDYSSNYIQLDGIGLSQAMIRRLLENYSSPDIIVAKIKENPYILIEEIDGIGWSKADEIALNNGFGLYDKRRIKAFICHKLEEETEEGNSWVEPNYLLGLIKSELGDGFDRKELSELMNEMFQQEILFWNTEKTYVCLKKYYDLEYSIARELLRINSHTDENSLFTKEQIGNVISNIEKNQDWNYTSEQIQGIENIVNSNVIILTGMAGTGKTSLLKGAISVIEPKSLAQTALSGKAASKMQEVTGMEGYTIHRLLDIDLDSGGFVYNENNQLPIDLLIIDEISMLGGILFYQLLKAIRTDCKLIMVGDTGQLEAIGKLNVLKDMIESGVIKHVELTQIHRQALKSAIITESCKVRKHEQITQKDWIGLETRGELQDFVIHCYADKMLSYPTTLHHFREEYERLGSAENIQVLCAKKESGDVSVFELNNAIQDIVNPPSNNAKEVIISLNKNSKYSLRVNDKVMIYKNNYKTINEFGDRVPVFNGWVGKIVDIDEDIIFIYFDIIKDVVVFEKKYWHTIMLGYASTVHKFQGSQEEVVIQVIDFTGYMQLTKEFLYTGITRASKKYILCAEKDALRYAISKSNIITKQTFLCQALKELYKEREL